MQAQQMIPPLQSSMQTQHPVLQNRMQQMALPQQNSMQFHQQMPPPEQKSFLTRFANQHMPENEARQVMFSDRANNYNQND